MAGKCGLRYILLCPLENGSAAVSPVQEMSAGIGSNNNNNTENRSSISCCSFVVNGKHTHTPPVSDKQLIKRVSKAAIKCL